MKKEKKRKISLNIMKRKSLGGNGVRLEAKGTAEAVTRRKMMVAQIGRWQQGYPRHPWLGESFETSDSRGQ